MSQNKYNIKHRLNKKILVCINDDIEAHIEDIFRDKRQRYKNRSHVVRVAIMRLHDEEKGHKRKGLISDVCKGLRERISRGNKDGKFNKKTKQADKKAI